MSPKVKRGGTAQKAARDAWGDSIDGLTEVYCRAAIGEAAKAPSFSEALRAARVGDHWNPREHVWEQISAEAQNSYRRISRAGVKAMLKIMGVKPKRTPSGLRRKASPKSPRGAK